MAQQVGQDQRRALRPDWGKRDTSDVFFADAVNEAFGGHWPPSGETGKTRESPGSLEAPSHRSLSNFVWSKAVDAELLLDEIKRFAQELKQATRSKSTWDKYGRDKLQIDLATAAVLFRAISEWDEDVRFKSDGLTISCLLSEAASVASHAPASALNSARAVSDTLQQLVLGNPIDVKHSRQQPLDWGATVDRSQLMARLELAIEQNAERGLQSTNDMSRRQQELLREANVSIAIFAALLRDGCEDADQEAYLAYCKAAARQGIALRDAVKQSRYLDACQALNRLHRSCTDCHEDYRY